MTECWTLIGGEIGMMEWQNRKVESGTVIVLLCQIEIGPWLWHVLFPFKHISNIRNFRKDGDRSKQILNSNKLKEVNHFPTLEYASLP